MNEQLPLGMTKVPVCWPMLAQAYIDFAMWAIGQEEFINQFEADTGVKYSPPKCDLDKLIDEATGASRAVIGAFLDWLTVNHWGEE